MKKEYILFNKPFGVISQFTTQENKITLKNFGFPKNFYSVGRLDEKSEGLLLLTNDGLLHHKLINPKFEHKKIYLCQVENIPNEIDLEKLRKGIIIDGKKTLPAKVELLSETPNIFPRSKEIRFRKNIPTSWLKIILKEGKNRQIRKMTAKINCPTLRLIRIEILFLSIENLAIGKWRYLTNEEVLKLKKDLSI